MTKEQAVKKFAEKMRSNYSWENVFEIYFEEYLKYDKVLEVADQWEMHSEIDEILQGFFTEVER